jgi:hypothetical protein
VRGVDGRVFGGGISGILTVGEGIWVGFFLQCWVVLTSQLKTGSGSHLEPALRTAVRTCLAVLIGDENRLVRIAHGH